MLDGNFPLDLEALERLSPGGGARIRGIDLARPLSSGDKDVIDTAFLVHHIVVFPGQSLSRE